jgi:hypothetical protein
VILENTGSLVNEKYFFGIDFNHASLLKVREILGFMVVDTLQTWNIAGMDNPYRSKILFDNINENKATFILMDDTNVEIGNYTIKLESENYSVGIYVSAGSSVSQNTYYTYSTTDIIQGRFDYFHVKGVGDLDMLARDASVKIGTQQAMIGGTASLKRYMWPDISSQMTNLDQINVSSGNPYILDFDLVENKSFKSIWRPQGSIMALNDALPSIVFGNNSITRHHTQVIEYGVVTSDTITAIENESTESTTIRENNSYFEDWLEGGGKYLQVSGAIPFYWISIETELIEQGYIGHQKIYDINSDNRFNSSFKYGFYYDAKNTENEGLNGTTINSVNGPINENEVF